MWPPQVEEAWSSETLVSYITTQCQPNPLTQTHTMFHVDIFILTTGLLQHACSKQTRIFLEPCIHTFPSDGLTLKL